MKKHWIIALAISFLALGCANDVPEDGANQQATDEQQAAGELVPAGQQASDEPAASQGRTSFEHAIMDFESTMAGMTVKTRYYIADYGNRMRTEVSMMGMQTIAIVDGDISYILTPLMKTAMKFDDPEMMEEEQGEGLPDYDFGKLTDAELLAEGITRQGQEEVAGKTCDVFTLTNEEGTTKIWVWENFPIKTVARGPQGNLEMVVTQIDTESPVADELFEVPAGYAIQDMTQHMGQ